jgi:cytidylate kinase
LLDTTNLDIEAAITAAIAQVEAAIARKSAES